MSAYLPSVSHISGQARFDYAQHFYFADLPNLQRKDNIYFQNELKVLIPKIFEKQYPRLSARSLFPINRDGGPTARSLAWRHFESTGEAKIFADYDNSIPLVNSDGQEFSANIRGIAVAAEWSLQEIRESSALGRPLSTRYAFAARETILRTENQIAFSGSPEFKLMGLMSNNSLIPENPAPNGSWTWATPVDDIFEDLDYAVNTILDVTNEVEAPNVLAMAPTAYRLIASRKHGTDTESKILRHFLTNNPYIQQVVPVRELETAGPGGTRVMVAYHSDPDKIELGVPLDLEQLAPQDHGFVTRALYHMRTAGLLIYRPKSAHIVTGI